MSFKSSWIFRGASRVLTALAILAVLGLATPSASASIAISYVATDVANSATTSGSGTTSVSVSPTTVGNFTLSLNVTTTNTLGSAGLTSITTTVNNTSSTTDTLDLFVTGQNYIAGTPGGFMLSNFSVSGTGGPPANASLDHTTASSWVGTTNGAYQMSINLDPLTGAPTSSTPLTTPYAFNGSPPGFGPNIFWIRGASNFSMTQQLLMTLGAGDQASFTITTSSIPSGGPTNVVPEPSTMALAGLGALGLIGYGLRRKARSA
jgi:hypothetical protein